MLLLTGMATSLFLLVDRRLGHRLLRAMMMGTLQLAALGALTWGLFFIDKWWVDIIWLLFMVAAITVFLQKQLCWGGRRLLLPIGGSVLTGILTIGAYLLWTLTPDKPFLSHHLLLPVAGLLLAHLLVSVKQGMLAYLGSLRHTTEHRQYLLSCGATHMESVLPSARRALRAALMPSFRTMASPAIISLPLVFCGMLMSGASPIAAAITVWLLTAACFTATIITLLVAFWLSDRQLFDQHDNLLAA